MDSAHTHAFSHVEEETHVSSDAAGLVQCEAKDADDNARQVGSKKMDSNQASLAAAHDAAGMVQSEAKDADDDARKASSKESDNKHGSLAAAHNVNAPTALVDSLHDGKLNDNPSCAENSTGAIDSVLIPATAFSGARPDCVFKLGHMGLGYYPDAQPADSATACKAYSDWSTNPHNTPQDCTSCVGVSATTSDAGISGAVPKAHVSSAEYIGKSINREESSVGQEAEGGASEAQVHTATAESEKQGRQEGKAEGAASEDEGHTATAESEKQGGQEGEADQAGKERDKGHYWGQALQYLDSCVQVCSVSTAAVSCSACIHVACSAGAHLVHSASLHGHARVWLPVHCW